MEMHHVIVRTEKFSGEVKLYFCKTENLYVGTRQNTKLYNKKSATDEYQGLGKEEVVYCRVVAMMGVTAKLTCALKAPLGPGNNWLLGRGLIFMPWIPN